MYLIIKFLITARKPVIKTFFNKHIFNKTIYYFHFVYLTKMNKLYNTY